MRSIKTIAVHAGAQPDQETGAVIAPIHLSTTFAQQSPGNHRGWDYSRAGNPTRDRLEEALSALEGACHCSVFSSGLAAEQAIVQAVFSTPGQRLIVSDDVYGGTGRLFRKLWPQLNPTFIDLGSMQQLQIELAKGDVGLVWVESPSNPLMKVLDIREIVATSRGVPVVVDNTFATPVFQQPLALGATMVLHSATKYLGGHSDIIAGCIMTNDEDLAARIKFVQFAAGAVLSPFDSFLLHRSIKTLPIRMKCHEENAQAVAEAMVKHSRVSEVMYPGLSQHPSHHIARSQMSGFSGMVSIRVDLTIEKMHSFLKKLRLFTLAESLGGVESLINHPETMTHASVPPELRKALGINSQLLRLSVGIESAEDLIHDLRQAFE